MEKNCECEEKINKHGQKGQFTCDMHQLSFNKIFEDKYMPNKKFCGKQKTEIFKKPRIEQIIQKRNERLEYLGLAQYK